MQLRTVTRLGSLVWLTGYHHKPTDRGIKKFGEAASQTRSRSVFQRNNILKQASASRGDRAGEEVDFVVRDENGKIMHMFIEAGVR